MLFPVTEPIIQINYNAAQNPAERISQRHQDNGMRQLIGYKQINLPEEDEAAHHDNHGRLGIARAAQ